MKNLPSLTAIFSSMNSFDEVSDEVSDEGTKG